MIRDPADEFNAAVDAVLFEGSSRRSEHKPAYYMCELELLQAAGNRMELGRLHHGRANFKEGGPEFVVETFNHMIEHLWKLRDGDESDDHIGAICANALILAWHKKNKPENFERLVSK